MAPVTGVTRYNLHIKQFQDQIVPASSGLGPTTLWGYVPTYGWGTSSPMARWSRATSVGS